MTHLMMKDLLENNFNHSLNLVNLTSAIAVKQTVFFLTLSQNGCTLSLPAKSCSQGHQVLLKIEIKEFKKPIEIVGKVTELSALDENWCEVKIHFHQYMKDEWQNILDLIALKQKNLSETIRKLKEI
jgi:hypothetical protein